MELSANCPRLIPVIDIRHNVAVRGIGGRRQEYRPIELSSDPVPLALELCRRAKSHELYLADLDAIEGRAANTDVWTDLSQRGVQLWIDAGVRTARDVDQLLDAEVTKIVAGLETLTGAGELRAIIETAGPARICFSLDLKAGKPLGGLNWPTGVSRIVESAVDAGVTQTLVLDLADVGSGNGPSTVALCRSIHERYPDLLLAAGGGVRNMADIGALGAAGVTSVLVSSALYAGSGRNLKS